MKFALGAGALIVGLSLAVAWICFKLLDSSASAELDNWKLGGAFAGFVFTAGMTMNITMQFHKQITADDVRKAQEKVEELQAKLIKGAPCPDGYEIDLDERRRIVFARPREWSPRSGILFSYVDRNGGSPGDAVRARFTVVHHTEDEVADLRKDKNGRTPTGPLDVERLYERILDIEVGYHEQSNGYRREALTREYVQVDGVRGLRYMHTYSYLAKPRERRTVCTSGVFAYVPRLNGVYKLTFEDDESDYLRSSEVFNTVVGSVRFL